MRHNFLWVVLVGAVVAMVGVFLQAFSISAYIMSSNTDALDMHGGGSMIVHLGELAIVVGAITAWWGNWRAVGAAIAFFVLSFVQVAFVSDAGEGSWINGLHGLLAIAVFLCAMLYFLRARTDLGVMGSSGASPGGA